MIYKRKENFSKNVHSCRLSLFDTLFIQESEIWKTSKLLSSIPRLCLVAAGNSSDDNPIYSCDIKVDNKSYL